MTKGKKWTLRLLGVAALALLICLCLLGSTMARYTSKGEGSGSLTVALWDLEATPVTLTTSQSVSPSDEEYSAETPRTNASAYIESFTLANNSDVAAAVSVELDTSKGITVEYQDGFSWTEGLSTNQANDYGLEIIEKLGIEEDSDFEAIINGFGLFDIALAYETGDTTGLTGVDSEGNSKYIIALEDGDSFSIEAGEEENFYAEVIWTSICEKDASDDQKTIVPDAYFSEESRSGEIDWESFSDDVDTILGLYGKTITFNVMWTAVQDSVLPPV